ncbi:hypothetical protein SASPL_101351 [Salvia splendens]|uniref:Uncharacterized protein n=1 Tax=Salvia splendens TaxID=180675 RepID=A0A8X9ABU7_SALSN|nr:hypothetical protein SASPL_101351 [Salvia splendens]
MNCRRIVEFRHHECQDAVEDVMYMLIFYNLSEIGVNLVPRLSKFTYNRRLEIWPSKDWELESIHSAEVLQMVKEHLTALIGCRAKSNVTDSWAKTEVQRFQLCEAMYICSRKADYAITAAPSVLVFRVEEDAFLLSYIELIFSLVTALSSLLTCLIFNGAAHVVVQMIQVMKVQGESSQRLLDQVKEVITKCMEMLMNLIVNAVVSVFSSSFNLVKEGLFSSSSGLAAAVVGLLEKSKTSFEDALKDVPEVLDAFTEMLGKIIADFVNNCSQAVAYVTENVF